MDDKLPDLGNSNSTSSLSSTPTNLGPQPTPAPVPTSPNPPQNLVDPVQSQAAKRQKRDAHGHFVKSDYVDSNSPNPSNSSHPSILPPVIEINQNVEPTKKEDPPLVSFSLTNPVTYLRKFLDKLIKRQAVTIRIPVLAILIVMVGAGGFGLGYNRGLTYTASKLFPDSSPILHRPITKQGVIQKSSKDYVLKAGNDLWKLKPSNSEIQAQLESYVGKPAIVKGNLTSDSFVIEVSEVVSY